MTSQNLPDAVPCNARKSDIFSLGEKAAKIFGYRPGMPLEKFVQKIGGRVVFDDDVLDKEVSGSIEVDGKGHFVIYLSRYTSSARDKFTVAHELGHFVLHSQCGKKPMKAGRGDFSHRVEWEANWFAAAFLMPENEFSAVVSAGKTDVEIAAHFGVSVTAVQVRKRDLGL